MGTPGRLGAQARLGRPGLAWWLATARLGSPSLGAASVGTAAALLLQSLGRTGVPPSAVAPAHLVVIRLRR